MDLCGPQLAVQLAVLQQHRQQILNFSHADQQATEVQLPQPHLATEDLGVDNMILKQIQQSLPNEAEIQAEMETAEQILASEQQRPHPQIAPQLATRDLAVLFSSYDMILKQIHQKISDEAEIEAELEAEDFEHASVQNAEQILYLYTRGEIAQHHLNCI